MTTTKKIVLQVNVGTLAIVATAMNVQREIVAIPATKDAAVPVVSSGNVQQTTAVTDSVTLLVRPLRVEAHVEDHVTNQ